jgi:hypothetical protein
MYREIPESPSLVQYLAGKSPTGGKDCFYPATIFGDVKPDVFALRKIIVGQSRTFLPGKKALEYAIRCFTR